MFATSPWRDVLPWPLETPFFSGLKTFWRPGRSSWRDGGVEVAMGLPSCSGFGTVGVTLYGDQPAPHAPLCCAVLKVPLDESSHAKSCQVSWQVQGIFVTNANSCTNQFTLQWWAVLQRNPMTRQTAIGIFKDRGSGVRCQDDSARRVALSRWTAVFNTSKCLDSGFLQRNVGNPMTTTEKIPRGNRIGTGFQWYGPDDQTWSNSDLP